MERVHGGFVADHAVAFSILKRIVVDGTLSEVQHFQEGFWSFSILKRIVVDGT